MRKRISAPSERPIQLRWIVFVRSGQSPPSRQVVLQQLVCVVRDLEEPLLEVPRLHFRSATLAVAVDDVLVRNDRLVVRAPVDRRCLPVREAALEELQEQPLRPAVELGLVGRDLAVPVDRPAQPLHLLAHEDDVALGALARMLAVAERSILGRQAERVEAHRAQHAPAAPPAQVRLDIAHRVVEDVPHVERPRRVREHLQLVPVALVRVLAGSGVRLVEGAFRLPDALPLLLDCLWVVSLHSRPWIQKSLSCERPWEAAAARRVAS